MAVDYEEGRRRYWAYDAALEAAVRAPRYGGPETGAAFNAENIMSAWLMDNRRELLGIPDDGQNLFGERVGPESAIDQIQRALYAGIHAIRDKQGKVDKSDPTVIAMEVAAARFGELRALLNPVSALSASEARAEAAEAMLLVFMAAPPDFTVDQARAAIAALRQRAAMDDLLRMDGELYDVSTNQEPRND